MNLQSAWNTLRSSATADKDVAEVFEVGLAPLLAALAARHLGPGRSTQGVKLVLGRFGGGKTHFLLSVRTIALSHGHPVAFIDLADAALGDSPVSLGRKLLMVLEVSETAASAERELRPLALLRAAVERKRAALTRLGLDPVRILPRWAVAMRAKDLQPWGLGAAVAHGLLAAIDGDHESQSRAADELAKWGTAAETVQNDEARNAVAAILNLTSLLELPPPVILIDTSETSIKPSRRNRLKFLQFCRFLADEVAPTAATGTGALVFLGLQDEHWPRLFQEHSSVYERFQDPGADGHIDRRHLGPAGLARLNKIWLGDLFPGQVEDYENLGAELVNLAGRLFFEMCESIQHENVRLLAQVFAQSSFCRCHRRRFIKTVCTVVEDQISNNNQYVLAGVEVVSLFTNHSPSSEDFQGDEAL